MQISRPHPSPGIVFFCKPSRQSWRAVRLKAVDLIIPSLYSPSETFFGFPCPSSLSQLSIFRRNRCQAGVAVIVPLSGVLGVCALLLVGPYQFLSPVLVNGLHYPPRVFKIPSIQGLGRCLPALTLGLVFWFALANEAAIIFTHVQRLNNLLVASAYSFAPLLLSWENDWATFWGIMFTGKEGSLPRPRRFTQLPGWPVADHRHMEWIPG